MKKNFNDFNTAKEAKTILTNMVRIVQHSDELDTDILVMDFDGIRGVIKREETDYEVVWKSLVGFIGRTVHFTVKEVDEANNTVYCSRKEAQEIMEPAVIERITNEGEFDVHISGLINYGAYVEVDGIYALLKNADFSDDHVPVKSVHNVGDKLRVRMKKVSEGEKISVEIVEKYVLHSIINFEAFERDQVILGTVNGVKPWGAYVTIAPGLDALCPIPEVGEVEQGTKVSIRITQIKPEERRVRGKILRTIQ